jgi:hypothetical protein
MLEYYRFKVVHDLFLKGQVDEACMQLKELQKRYLGLCEENAVLKTQVCEYEDIFYFARNFVFDGTFYWLITGQIKQGPFCRNCYNSAGRLARVTDMRPMRCSVCGEVYELPQTQISKSRGGGMARALEQAVAVNALRSVTAVEQMAQITLEQQKAFDLKEACKKRAKAKIIRFDPDFKKERAQ